MPDNPADDLSGNPCPFLRALVTDGRIDNDHDSIPHVSGVIADLFPPGAPKAPVRAAIAGIAAIGNGFWPWSVTTNVLTGLRAGELRGGPLDKRGAGSRILDQQGRFNEGEFERLDEFSIDYVDAATGATERGLGEKQLTAMMDANFARAESFRRSVDRKLMDGEWPILLQVLGKRGDPGRYLSLAELRDLFADRKLPPRLT